MVRLPYGMRFCLAEEVKEGGGEVRFGRMWRGKEKAHGMLLGMPDRLGGFIGPTLLGSSLEFALVWHR